MKNTIILCVSFTALVFAFLLREANVAIDAQDYLSYQMASNGYKDGCLRNSVDKDYIDCTELALDYMKEIKQKGW